MEDKSIALETPPSDLDSSPVGESSLRKQFFQLRTLLAFMASFAIIYFLFSRMNIDLAETWRMITHADPLRLVVGLVVYYGSFPIRGLRWRLLLRNAGFEECGDKELPSSWTLARFMAMGWFANCILPAKLGDAYRAYLAKREMCVSFSKVVGTVLAERVIDVMVIFVMLVVSAAAVVRYTQIGVIENIMEIGLAFVVIMAIGLAVMARFGGMFVQRLLPKRFHDIYQLFHEGTFHSFRSLPGIVALSIGIWLVEAFRIYMVAWSLGLSLDPALVVFVALTDALLVGIPLTPGGLGLVEAGLTGILMLAVSAEQAASVAILDRVISYWTVLVLGAGLHFWGFNPIRALRTRLYSSD
ncbi:MAG: lysylphosphatidylglycerol synthase transmembrane domain-containing protein [Dehalococcoidia bacterium]|nr:lysylphosphatidylglycerol synthase transmembrane domain-containing protein [Dehalococcoidia bacterium]